MQDKLKLFNHFDQFMKRVLPYMLLSAIMSCHLKFENNRISGYSKLPSLNLLYTDSLTVFNTNKIPEGNPTILIYFSPDCEHCQAETQDLLTNMNSLKNVQLYFITTATIIELKKYCQDFHFEQYNNIIAAKDYQYDFYRIYKVTSFPYLVIYNENKELVKLYKGETGIARIVNAIQSPVSRITIAK